MVGKFFSSSSRRALKGSGSRPSLRVKRIEPSDNQRHAPLNPFLTQQDFILFLFLFV